MLRVLVAMPRNEHGHNYSLDILALGLKQLVQEAGRGEVQLWPTPGWLHLREDPKSPGSWRPDPRVRDKCFLDCDAALPGGSLSGPADLVIGGAHAVAEFAEAARGQGGAKLAVIDGTDDTTDFRGRIGEAVRGRAFVYFKREIPTGAVWALSFPCAYPERWVPGPWHAERHGVVYCTSTHEGRAMARLCIADGLRALAKKGYPVEVVTSDDRAKRPSPEALHEKLWGALIGVHWNPFGQGSSHGWDSHRFPENCAFGAVTVGQRPFIDYPEPFKDGENVVWCDDPSQVAPRVQALLDDPERALKMARAAHEHFLAHHGAMRRAAYALRHCEIEVPA